jgi:DnaK suppressor protein
LSGETAEQPDDELRATLSADRARTVRQIAALEVDLADIRASTELVATDDEHDPEGSTIAFERARVEALLGQAREHLRALDVAERRVGTPSYGRCERCGRPIGAERLAARPTATTCIDCAGG